MKTVVGLIEQGRAIAEFLRQLTPADFARQTTFARWQVCDVVARLQISETRLLDALDSPTTQRPLSLTGYLGSYRPLGHREAELAHELAMHNSGKQLAAQFSQDLDEVAARLADPSAPAIVATDHGTLRSLDLVRVMVIDWTIAADDLSRALSELKPVAQQRQAMADAVRTFAEVLSQRYPGHSVEVRIPPFAAVQCGWSGEDPTHTRGTPPNVVECGPEVFLRLCTSRANFTEELHAGRVAASGTRSNLRPWLPLLGAE